MSAGRRLPLRNFSFFLVGKKSLTGLLVSFTDSGGIKVRIPLKMWGKSISTGRLVQEFRGGLNRLTMANFLKLLNEHVEAYLRTSFQYPLSKNQVVTHFSLPQGRKNRTITELFLSPTFPTFIRLLFRITNSGKSLYGLMFSVLRIQKWVTHCDL